MKTKISRMVGKLTISFLIFCALAISITAVQAVPSVSISPASTTVDKGEDFSILININPDGNQVKGVDIKLKFAPGSLQLNNADIGGFLGSNPLEVINDIDNTNGEVELAYAVKSGNPSATTAGTFATLEFTVKGNAPNGTSNLNLDMAVLSDQDGTTITGVAKNGGTVTVVGGGTTVNTAPVADNKAVTTSENTPVAITLTASDVDGDTLTYVVVSNPTHGTLSGTAPALTYTPGTGYNGTDTFTFKANDSIADSNIATVSITVTQSVPTLSVRVLPATTTVNQSDTFSVDVIVNPLGNQVKGVDVILKFAPNAVQLDSVDIGSFLGSTPLPVISNIDNTNGTLELAYAVKAGNPAVTATGTFATLNFKVKSNAPLGTSNLDINSVVLSDSDGNTISGVAMFDGTVTVNPPGPGAPVWEFITVPFKLENSSVDYVLQGVNYSMIYAWDPIGKKPAPVMTMEPLNGYVIRMNDSSQQVTNLVRKSGPYDLPSLDVYKGWNLIGTSGTNPMSAEMNLQPIDDSYYGILNWNVPTQKYDIIGINRMTIPAGTIGTDAFMMQPKVSYWVWATANTSMPGDLVP